MSCEEARPLLHAYIDGELDLSGSLAIEEHLRTCTVCSGGVAAVRALSEGIVETALRYQAPARLEDRVRAMAQAPRNAAARRRRSLPLVEWGVVALAAGVAFVAILLKGGNGLLFHSARTDRIAQEVVADHVRSLMVNHLTDVLSSNQHTVKPWFEGKLDFSPTVVDLTPQGFKLVGGRLDYLGGRPVAAIVYQRRAHPINVFVWPYSSAPDTDIKLETSDGYNLAHWNDAGMTYWAASSLNLDELGQFVADLRRPVSPPPASVPSNVPPAN
jgi:anti-sigma factor RsiW